MQRAVERDEHNHSNYAMCAVNPSRISKTFDDLSLREVVDSISRETNLLLEIVKNNVEVNAQFSVFRCMTSNFNTQGQQCCARESLSPSRRLRTY